MSDILMGIFNYLELDMKNPSQSLFDRLVDEIKRQSCPNCMHWNIEEEFCTKFKQRPPAKVIVRGCEHFDEDEIPF